MSEPDLRDHLFWILVAAALIASADPGGWLRRKARRLSRLDARSNLAARAFHVLRGTHSFKKRESSASLKEARECLLQAAAIDLQNALGIHEEHALKTNLVIAVPPDTFQVIARSRLGSPLDVVYPKLPNTAAGKAMDTNTTVVASDVKPLSGQDHRSYRSVAATPISMGKQAFGAITADSNHARTFKGKEALIDQILRPYAAAILLTFSGEAPSFTCPERFE